MKITVGKGSCGIAAGADAVFDLLSEKAPCPVTVTGCVGACYLEPIVNVDTGGAVRTYVKVDENGALEIVKLLAGEENSAGDYAMKPEDGENGQRIALRNCGLINPENIDDYMERDGYKAAEKCARSLSPPQVIQEIKISGRCGRGGAGFPTWFKWQAARDSEGDKKYVICNADEGDPGAFMDRAILEGDPHAVIEGMIIAAYAIGADEGIVYVRAEYPLAIVRLEKALEQSREKGFLGENAFGGGDLPEAARRFDIRIKEGAGAFVCGEETALIASLEGERGMPRLKPPFPAQKGYRKKPSNINNVETYANIPWIIRNGGEAFAAIGTEKSKGTKVFALTGKIAKGGLAEVPMGCTVGDVVYKNGGGVKDGKELKAVQLGGPSGGCIPKRLTDTEIDYGSLAATGAIMGSGGMVVMDETTCMVDMARFFLDFTCKESCGKCTHCRIGNRRMLEILERICRGEGKEGDIELLTELGGEIKAGSLCALGQTAPNPVLTTIRYFRNEYEEHIVDKKCAARQCKPLLTFSIDGEKCAGCTLCAKKCPYGAIDGAVKSAHAIDAEKCVKCGSCADVCKFGAVNTK
ncbi:MAG: NADH-quinone oxidoreductase subunit NuoF [Oscillospiraceae bacterium]|jgi:NADH-quinone oxidoreductase subunit F|nr:NADH-quinone oxidoreductase subunit NuoF [Oscillospiraceae bacterium]